MPLSKTDARALPSRTLSPESRLGTARAPQATRGWHLAQGKDTAVSSGPRMRAGMAHPQRHSLGVAWRSGATSTKCVTQMNTVRPHRRAPSCVIPQGPRSSRTSPADAVTDTQARAPQGSAPEADPHYTRAHKHTHTQKMPCEDCSYAVPRQELPEAGGSPESDPAPGALKALPTPRCHTSSLQGHETTDFCCSEPPSL